MAQYSHLAIYNKAFALLREFYLRVPKFSKQYKYLLGERLIGDNIEIIRLIIRVNSERDNKRRIVLLENMCMAIESLIINIRIANELKQLGKESAYLYLSEIVVDLSKQAEGWRKYTPQNS